MEILVCYKQIIRKQNKNKKRVSLASDCGASVLKLFRYDSSSRLIYLVSEALPRNITEEKTKKKKKFLFRWWYIYVDFLSMTLLASYRTDDTCTTGWRRQRRLAPYDVVSRVITLRENVGSETGISYKSKTLCACLLFLFLFCTIFFLFFFTKWREKRHRWTLDFKEISCSEFFRKNNFGFS